jgi:hypothetical protein
MTANHCASHAYRSILNPSLFDSTPNAISKKSGSHMDALLARQEIPEKTKQGENQHQCGEQKQEPLQLVELVFPTLLSLQPT